jgi:hypothetical protein
MHQLQQDLDEAKKVHDMRQPANGPPTRVTAVPFTMAVPLTAEAPAAPLAAGAPAAPAVMPVHPAEKDAELPPVDPYKTILDAQEGWKYSQGMLSQANGDPPPPTPYYYTTILLLYYCCRNSCK